MPAPKALRGPQKEARAARKRQALRDLCGGWLVPARPEPPSLSPEGQCSPGFPLESVTPAACFSDPEWAGTLAHPAPGLCHGRAQGHLCPSPQIKRLRPKPSWSDVGQHRNSGRTGTPAGAPKVCGPGLSSHRGAWAQLGSWGVRVLGCVGAHHASSLRGQRGGSADSGDCWPRTGTQHAVRRGDAPAMPGLLQVGLAPPDSKTGHGPPAVSPGGG